MKMNFSKDELAMVYQYAAGTKEDTLAGLKEIVPVIRDRQTRDIVENTIRKLDAIPEPECRRFIADTKQRFTVRIPDRATQERINAAGVEAYHAAVEQLVARAQAVRPAPIKEQMAEAAKHAGKENAARPAPAKEKEARNDR